MVKQINSPIKYIYYRNILLLSIPIRFNTNILIIFFKKKQYLIGLLICNTITRYKSLYYNHFYMRNDVEKHKIYSGEVIVLLFLKTI